MDIKTITMTGGVSLVVGVASVFLSYASFQRENQREASSIEASVAENRVRIEGISKLLEKVDRIDDVQSDLKVLQSQSKSGASEAELRAVAAQMAKLQERLEQLEARPGTTGTVSPKQVAAILAQDYADILRGPKGDPGADGKPGPQGPAGEGSVTSVTQDETVRNLMTFTSDYGSRQLGPFKMDLQGCFNNGGSVTCKFVLLNTGPDRERIYFQANSQWIALANGEWVRSENVRLLKYSASSFSPIDYTSIPALPTTFEVDFPNAQTADVGLPVVKLNIQTPNGSVEWLKVKF